MEPDKRNISATALEEGKSAKADVENEAIAKRNARNGDDKWDNEKYSKREENSWRYWKLLFCFIGLQASYLSWGLVQEIVMTKSYTNGKFKNSAFCVFSNRFFALIIALLVVLYKRLTSPKPLKEAPFYLYAPCSLSNSLSSWAQYESLKYVSFPTQVLSKSCKIIPVMLVGMLVNRRTYALMEYLEAALITGGVTVFTLSEKTSPAHLQQASDSSFGVLLLALYLACDSFTSQWQSKVYKSYSVDQFQMMLGVNAWSLLLTGLTLYQSGELVSSFAFVLSDPSALMHVTILSVTSATGQLFIFYTIKEFGPVTFTIMMTTRQILSLFLSLLWFGHTIGLLGWLSSLSVFGVVFYRIFRKSN